MSDTKPSAADIRRRVAHHTEIRDAAEARRASLLASRTDAIALLTSVELDEIDDEIDHLGVAIERAASRIATLEPALSAAEVRETEAEARQRDQVERAVFAKARIEALNTFAEASPDRALALAQATLAASGPVVTEYSPALFEMKPAPILHRVDERQWHEDRERRLRAEGAVPADRPAPTFSAIGFGAHNVR